MSLTCTLQAHTAIETAAMRDRKLASLFVATGLLLSLPLAVGAFGSSKLGDRAGKHRERTSGAGPADIAAYEGLGTWLDMFNARPWRSPEAAVEEMWEHGTRTIYVETSNFSQRFTIFKPEEMGRLIEAAHARDMDVVAWYLPSFKNIRKDLKRSEAAIEFESPSGERFDSFALDIESTEVDDIATRNRRAISLSKKIRSFVGDDYPLGAIIPDPHLPDERALVGSVRATATRCAGECSRPLVSSNLWRRVVTPWERQRRGELQRCSATLL